MAREPQIVKDHHPITGICNEHFLPPI